MPRNPEGIECSARPHLPTERFRSQHFSCRMVLESKDKSQEAGEISDPQIMKKRQKMSRKRELTYLKFIQAQTSTRPPTSWPLLIFSGNSTVYGAAAPAGLQLVYSGVCVPETTVTGGQMMRAQVQGPTGQEADTLCVVPDSVATETDVDTPASPLISSKSRLRSTPTST